MAESTQLAVKAGGMEITDQMIEQAVVQRDQLKKFYEKVLVKGTDYGVIPGTQKPSLWKPGAELLAIAGAMAGEPKIVTQMEDFDAEHPFFHYVVECPIINRRGEFLGRGYGSANTRETRYAFRWTYENRLPKSVNKEELESRGTGNSIQYKLPTPADEVYTQANTVLKMAKKRAYIDAVLTVTGASRIFTQDLKEEEDEDEEKVAAAPVPPKGVTVAYFSDLFKNQVGSGLLSVTENAAYVFVAPLKELAPNVVKMVDTQLKPSHAMYDDAKRQWAIPKV